MIVFVLFFPPLNQTEFLNLYLVWNIKMCFQNIIEIAVTFLLSIKFNSKLTKIIFLGFKTKVNFSNDLEKCDASFENKNQKRILVLFNYAEFEI